MNRIRLSNFAKNLQLETIYAPKNIENIFITSGDVSRVGLEIIGDIKFYDPRRVLLVGQSEETFLSGEGLIKEELKNGAVVQKIEKLLSMKPPVMVVANPVEVPNLLLDIVKKYEIPLMRSKYETGQMINSIVDYLNMEFSPRIVRSGGFMNIYGEGVFIIGDSGIGKSEVELELLKRGHKLISDDTVELRKSYYDSIIGQSPSGFGQFIEVRGIGIINVRRLFGVGAIKQSDTLSLMVKLEAWDDSVYVERLETIKYSKIFGVKIPYVSIPVKPGRNTAVLIEVAAMNNRQKNLGYSATRDLCSSLNMDYFEVPVEEIDCKLQ